MNLSFHFVSDKPERPDYIQARINRLAGLQPNWGTYGAPPITGTALEETAKAAAAVDACGIHDFIISPTSTGGCQLEWVMLGINPAPPPDPVPKKAKPTRR